jgi:hypothetical protein
MPVEEPSTASIADIAELISDAGGTAEVDPERREFAF